MARTSSNLPRLTTTVSASSLASALFEGLALADKRAALDERLRRKADMSRLLRLVGAVVVAPRDGSREVPRISVGSSSSKPSLASYSGTSDSGDAGGEVLGGEGGGDDDGGRGGGGIEAAVSASRRLIVAAPSEH